VRSKIRRNGKCRHCGYRFRMTVGGLMYSHWLYGGPAKFRCEGSGFPRAPYTPMPHKRTQDAPLVFTPRCHPDGGTLTAYLGGGLMQVDCIECGAKVVNFEVARASVIGIWATSAPDDPPEPACPDCGWAMSDHGDPPMCPPVPGEPVEGGSRR
jgi:hypothetical protein